MKKTMTFFFGLLALASQAQIIVDTNTPLPQMVQTFVGNGITISNVAHTGGPGSIALFSGATNLPIQNGLMLSSGFIDSTINLPASSMASGYGSAVGDADLSVLTGTPTFDASVLEFDFVASGTIAEFRYLFLSEEYNEFVGSSFNDAFALFISGPGINGADNIALIPGINLPVAINNVNNGNAAGLSNGPCFNCAFYIDNYNDSTFIFDGLTTKLTASHAITPGTTYHLKLVVADASDMILDSGILLEAYSLKSTGNSSLDEIKDINHFFVQLENIVLFQNMKTNSTVAVIDAAGKTAISTSATNSKTIDLSALSAGIYTLQIHQGESLLRTKILVK
ncbi:MAG: T9SS type A sorting domain-containing protein [Bacteroidetes bacterium]|nr:T9SS type A sorting domain-containing protein [Bacteroidota bacterium]